MKWRQSEKTDGKLCHYIKNTVLIFYCWISVCNDRTGSGKKCACGISGCQNSFLTTFSDDEYIIEAFEIGVKDTCSKQDYEGLVPAIRAAASGQIVFGGKIVDKLPGLLGGTAAYDYAAQGITQKEYEMIQLVAQGLSNKEIAEKTFLSEGTIRNYISTVLEKLNLRDRTQLAVFYYQNGGR